MQTNNYDDFEDSQKYSEDYQFVDEEEKKEDSDAFDNAFQYDNDDFKSEISES